MFSPTFSKLRLSLAALAASSAIFATSQSSFAAIKTWDGDDAANGNGWINGLNWDNDTAPLAGDSLVFAGTAGLTALNNYPDTTLFSGISFAANAGSFTLTGSNDRLFLAGDIINSSTNLQTLTNLLPMVLQQNITIGTVGDISIASLISGAFGITKTGAGTLTLSNAGSNYTGPTTVTAGTLNIGVTYNSTNNTGPAGVTASPIILSGGNLSLGAFTIANPIQVLSNATITNTTTNGVFELRGAITGSSTLTFAVVAGATITLGNGSATTLATLANFMGTVSFGTSGGQFRFNGASSGQYTAGSMMAAFDLGTGTVTFRERNGGVINLGSLSGTGTGTNLTGASNSVSNVGYPTDYHIGFLNTNTTFAGRVTDNSTARITTLTKEGTGSLTLTNSTNNYTGFTTVNAGTLVAQGDNTLGGSTNITIKSGGALTLAGGLNNTYLSDFANVTLNVTDGTNPNGIINVNFAGTDNVNSLTVGGVALNPGTYTQTTPETAGYLFGTGSLTVAPVPEPSTWAMVLGGLGVLTMARRSRRQKQTA